MHNYLVRTVVQGNLRKTATHLQEQIEHQAGDSFLLARMAWVLYNLRKDDEAMNYICRLEAMGSTMPLQVYTKGLILRDRQMYQESIRQWDILLQSDMNVLCQKDMPAYMLKALKNDARFYKANCLYCIYKEDQALTLITEHIKERKKGLESDFTLKEAREFQMLLELCGRRPRGITPRSQEGIPTKEQCHRIERYIKRYDKEIFHRHNIQYLKRKCKEFPLDYWLKTVLSEYLYIENDKECLEYASAAYAIAPDDMLVVYNYACAFYLNQQFSEAKEMLNIIISCGIDYLAYSEHGEGMRWAKQLMKDTKSLLERIKAHNR